jgi:hypothetical protein
LRSVGREKDAEAEFAAVKKLAPQERQKPLLDQMREHGSEPAP